MIALKSTDINGLYVHEGDTYFLDEQGYLHNDDGPAVISRNGTKFWYKHGQMHRVGGPAIEYIDGSYTWYFKGQYHRDNGPAHSRIDGLKNWWIHGKLSRLDGPAIISPIGSVEFWIDGQPIQDPSPEIWLFLKANPENVQYFQNTTLKMQEYVVRVRPDLIQKIPNLYPILEVQYSHEVELGRVDL
jgi:hypothetical protein